MNPRLRIEIDANAIQRRYCRKVAERYINDLRAEGVQVFRCGSRVEMIGTAYMLELVDVELGEKLKPWLLQLLDEESSVRN